jgi:hypothetical protein
LRLRIGQGEANRGGEEDLAVVEGDRGADGLADGLGEGGDAAGSAPTSDQADWSPASRQRVLRLEDA